MSDEGPVYAEIVEAMAVAVARMSEPARAALRAGSIDDAALRELRAAFHSLSEPAQNVMGRHGMRLESAAHLEQLACGGLGTQQRDPLTGETFYDLE